MRWKENQAEGRKLLDAISTDVEELHTVLGPDYTMIATQLGINVVASVPGEVMASGGQSNAVAGPSGSNSKTTTATTKKKRPKEAGASSPSHPPPKRQRQQGTGEPVDVIDLT